MKKRVLFIFSFTAVLFVFFVFSASAVTKGDVNFDGAVEPADARSILRMSVGLEDYGEGTDLFYAADVDDNGLIEPADARTVLRVSVGLDLIRGKQLTPTEIYQLASLYSFEIRAENDEYTSTGTGFAISDDGKIVTNYHVIDGMYSITAVDSEGEEYPVVKVLAYSRTKDIAVLKINAKTKPAKLNYSAYETGNQIFALGSSQGYTGTFSDGIISSVSRYVPDYNREVQYIQITAPITHGNSGGPLIDAYGWVIGINTWTQIDGQNLNFAIPVRYISGLDYSAPLSPYEFYEYSNKANYYVSFINDSIEMKYCATKIALITASLPSDAHLTYELSDDNALSCTWNDWLESEYDNAISLNMTALKSSATVKIKVYINEYPDIYDTLTVKVTSSADPCYSFSSVPDIGAYFKIPSYYSEFATDYTVITVWYDAGDVYAAGYEYADDFIGAVADLLWAYGFEYNGYDEYSDCTRYYYYNYDTGESFEIDMWFDDYGNYITDYSVYY